MDRRLDAGGEAKVPPSVAHPFGTDRIGHDMLASIISGTRYSLQIALVVAGVSTALGVVLGALAGYLGGWVDQAVSRLIDLMLVIPQLVVVAVLARNSFSVVPGQNSSEDRLMRAGVAVGEQDRARPRQRQPDAQGCHARRSGGRGQDQDRHVIITVQRHGSGRCGPARRAGRWSAPGPPGRRR